VKTKKTKKAIEKRGSRRTNAPAATEVP